MVAMAFASALVTRPQEILNSLIVSQTGFQEEKHGHSAKIHEFAGFLMEIFDTLIVVVAISTSVPASHNAATSE